MDRRQALKLLTALGATGLASACGSRAGVDLDAAAVDAVSDVPVRVGLIAPQSGPDKAIGDEIVKGFELFLNLNGRRLGGHPAELVTADEGDSVESGRAALDSLLAQDVLALTGVVNSSVMLGIRDAVEQAQVPLVGSNASPTALQSVVYIWRTSYVNDEPGKALGPYVAAQLPRKGTVSIVATDDLLGRDTVAGFREAFGASDPRIAGDVVWAPVAAKPGRSTYRNQVEELVDRDPDAIFCAFSGSAAVAFVKQLRAAGYHGPNRQIYGPGMLTEGSVIDELGADATDVVTASNYSADLRNAANRHFATAWEIHRRPPTTFAMASYDAAQVLDKAIRLTGEETPGPQQVNLALGRVGQIDSPRGRWQFNQPRTPHQMWYLREVRRDGQVLSNVLIGELGSLG